MAEDGGGSGKAASRRKVPGTTGRVTPKGTQPRTGGAKRSGPRAPGRPTAHAGEGHVPEASARYTPPIPQSQKVSPRWVPILMFALLGLGVLLIIVNYLGLLPGGSDNLYLLAGLAAITGGFVTATQYR